MGMKLLNIVFSYNRAIQLDCFINSFIEHIKYTNYKIAVVYHTSGAHNKGYQVLINKYKNNQNIEFYERSEINNFFLRIFPLLFFPRNLYRFLKHKYLRKNIDNFKYLVEDIIKNSACKLTMFSTDDTYYDADILLDNIVINNIINEPGQYSYRLCLGQNIGNEDNPTYQIKDNIIYWDYYKNLKIKGWGYPFIVDGTIYSTSIISKLLRRQIYHMPATLESFVNTYVFKKKLLGKGMCPLFSCLSNIWLNRVQSLGYHNSLDINLDMLNEKYIEGYTIEYIYQKPVKNWGIEPEKVILKNNKKELVIYDMSES